MAITFSENSATIGSTEYSLPNNSTSLSPQTTTGIFQLWLDLNAMGAGDQFELKVYEKVTSGGTQRVGYRALLVPQTDPAYSTISLILGNGWDMTLKKIAGTDRSIPWSIRKVA